MSEDNGGNGKDLVAFQELTDEQKFLYFFGENSKTQNTLKDIRKDMRIITALYGAVGGATPVGAYIAWQIFGDKTPTIIIPAFAKLLIWLGGAS